MGLEKNAELPKQLLAYDETRKQTSAPLPFVVMACTGCHPNGSGQVEAVLKGPEIGLFL